MPLSRAATDGPVVRAVPRDAEEVRAVEMPPRLPPSVLLQSGRDAPRTDTRTLVSARQVKANKARGSAALDRGFPAVLPQSNTRRRTGTKAATRRGGGGSGPSRPLPYASVDGAASVVLFVGSHGCVVAPVRGEAGRLTSRSHSRTTSWAGIAAWQDDVSRTGVDCSALQVGRMSRWAFTGGRCVEAPPCTRKAAVKSGPSVLVRAGVIGAA